VLDEPTAGLDPLMEAEFRRCVAEERRNGRTVLLSSHVLSEVEALCDRVTLIRDGHTVESGSLAQLRHLSRTEVIAELHGTPPDLTALPGVHDVTVQGNRITCHVEPAAFDAVVQALAGAGIAALSSRPPTLEELFLQHYAPVTAQPQAVS
jgi:ABC-2 type transport system ATP-binding protein